MSDRVGLALGYDPTASVTQYKGFSDAVYDEVIQVFNEKEIADLTFAAATINSWNRIAIASRMVPGLYQPAKKAAAQTTAD